MGLAQLLFKKGNFIDKVEIDIIVREGAQTQSRFTKNPIEYGADINDHIIIEPMTFNVEGAVSNVSASTFGQFTSAAALSTRTKAQETWDKLLKLQSDKTLFTLIQDLKTYSNVQITSLQESQDSTNSNALFFTCQMTEFIIPPVQFSGNFGDQDTYDGMTPTNYGGIKLA